MAIAVLMPVTAIYDHNDDDDDCDDDDEDGDDDADKDNDNHRFSLKVPVGWSGALLRGIAVSSLSIALCSLSDFSGTTSHHLYK